MKSVREGSFASVELAVGVRSAPAARARRLVWLALASACVFAGLASAMVLGLTAPLDIAAMLHLHRFDSGMFAILMRSFTIVGSPALTLLVALAFAASVWPRDRQASSVLVGVAVASVVLDFGFKLGFHRARPALFPNVIEPSGYSFPSEHSMAAVAIYGMCAAVLVHLRPRLKLPMLILITALAMCVGLSRVVLGVHWPTDVLGGFAAGMCVLGIGAYALKYNFRRAGSRVMAEEAFTRAASAAVDAKGSSLKLIIGEDCLERRRKKARLRCWVYFPGLALLAAARCLAAETARPLKSPLTLGQAVKYALAHQPTLSAQQAIERQAMAGVETARAGYVQQMDVSQSVNWAQAAHNPAGLYLPLPGFPSPEGPQNQGSFGPGAWNSGTSAFVSEDIAALVRQMSVVDAALAKRSQQAAATDEQRLIVAFGAAQAFLNEAAAMETVKAARAGVMRDRAFTISIGGLVHNGLRPGADLARAQAQLALTRNLEIQAENNQAVAYAALAQALGAFEMPKLRISDSELLNAPMENGLPLGPSLYDPLLRASAAGISATKYQARAARLEYLPRFDVITGIFGRGSGVGYGGTPLSPGSGTLPNSYNFAAGVVFTIPIEQILAAHADTDMARANLKLARAQYRETVLQLRTQFDSARVILANAARMADNTTAELAAARASQRQNTARYRPGLATAVDVATANQVLTQAEIDNSVANINVWQAYLLVWRAAGDLDPFLNAYERAEHGSR